ncbi:MAG: DsbE family thiol:disulfide interchange protein [Aquabacterium sp.]
MTDTATVAHPLPRPPRREPRLLLWISVVLLLALLALLAAGMGRDPRALPSALIGKPWPDMALPTLQVNGPDGPPVNGRSWHGQARVVNLWASWCAACRQEHAVLLDLQRRLQAAGRADALVGLNYKDARADAQGFLRDLGNPFAMTLVDAEGRLGIELGVYGAPETFVVDAEGRILHKHVGALTPAVVARELLPRLGLKP